MRIGVFGGAFDPVHFGHLVLAEQCREQGRLDEVRFVPTARPPHKPRPGARSTSASRCWPSPQPAIAFLRLMRSKKIVKAPATRWTPSTRWRRQPGDDFWLLAGGDVAATFICGTSRGAFSKTTGLLVMTRPGTPEPKRDELAARLDLPAVRLEVVEAPLIDIASSDLRRRAAEGRNLRYLLPRAVECYVRDKRLYQGDDLRFPLMRLAASRQGAHRQGAPLAARG